MPVALAASMIWVVLSCQRKPDQKPKTLEELKQQITSRLEAEEGDFAVAFKDLQTGEEILINDREIFHAASTMKTPVMIEIFKKANTGMLSLQDSIVIKNEFGSIVDGSPYSLNPEDDSELELYKQLGSKRPLSDLVYDMIIMSSNLATNIVIELADAQHINQTMRELGAESIQVLRGVEDQKAYDNGLNNTTTAYDLMLIFQKMAAGEIVNQEASNAMINILLDQKINNVIPAKLSAEAKVAHKTGNIRGVQHDSGIVFRADGSKYVLVLLSKNLKDELSAIDAMASVSEMIYNR